MKLTNYKRDSFVNAVMQDVPQVDYAAKFKKLVIDDAYSQLPKEVKAVVDAKLTRYLTHQYYYMTHARCLSGIAHFQDDYRPTKEVAEQLTALHNQHIEQRDRRSALAEKLRGAIYSCTTVKQAKQLLPEFIKYLPDDDVAPTKQLPQIAGLVADLTAAGLQL